MKERRKKRKATATPEEIAATKVKMCPSFTRRLYEGDFAYYNGRFWKVKAHPCKETKAMKEENADEKSDEDETYADATDYGLTYVGIFD